VLVPTVAPKRPGRKAQHLRAPTEAEISRSKAGIQAAMGSWTDVDTETLKQELRNQREIVTRPLSYDGVSRRHRLDHRLPVWPQ
jgi:hypothetical protein